MSHYTPTVAHTLGGRYRLFFTNLTHNGSATEVTTFRGAPTQIGEYSNGDPAGDGAASFTFPAITGFDDLDSPEFTSWLVQFANVELYWVPVVPWTSDYSAEQRVINPLTQEHDLVAPMRLQPSRAFNAIKVWEGFVTTFDDTLDESNFGLQVQCVGALYQLDRYLAKPAFLRRPIPMEELIKQTCDPTGRSQLRTQPLRTVWPTGWTKVAPAYTGTSDPLTPLVKPGAKWTGQTSRNTGAWDRALTGYIQELLAAMITDESTGVTPGNQWTLQHDRSGVGRTPVLMIRDRFRAVDFELKVGTPGVSHQLTADNTQTTNVMFGEGIDVGGTQWRNAIISNDGSRTDYKPLAADRTIYPYDSPAASTIGKGRFVSESHQSFLNGMNLEQASAVAGRMIIRDQQPGVAGTITLKCDVVSTASSTDLINPTASGQIIPRALLRAGMTLLYKGYRGADVRLHIAQVQIAPMDGTATLTVDSRYRDLLSIEESIARNRDPLTPSKLLRVGQNSTQIEDVVAPWDYSAGSGYVPIIPGGGCKPFFDSKPAKIDFPYEDWTRANPPMRKPHYYVQCNANNPDSLKRWAGPVTVFTGEKGTIGRTEFAVYDIYGKVLKIPFHVSFYKVNVQPGDMPHQGLTYSAFLNGAFEKIDPATGLPWSTDAAHANYLAPQESFIIGWGNRSQGVYNRAGFSPGREPDGHPPTGLLVDEGIWQFNNDWKPYFMSPRPGEKYQQTDIAIYAMFYCEYTAPVYFMGRLFRQNQQQPGGG